MTDKDWMLLHAALMCMDFTEPRSSVVHWPTHSEWKDWSIPIYRSAVIKASGRTGTGPLYVCSWLSMRAATYGWDDLFETWARKAHEAGEVDRQMLDTPLWKKMSRRLALDERTAIAACRFRTSYEKEFGYPVSSSPLAEAQRAEEAACAYSSE